MTMTTKAGFVKKGRECGFISKSIPLIIYFLAAISPISCCRRHRFTCVPTILNKRHGYDVPSSVATNRWTKLMTSLCILNKNNNGMIYSPGRRRKSHLEVRGGGGRYSGHESHHYHTTANRDGKVSIPPSKEQNVESAAAKTNEQSPFEYIPITALNDYGQSTQLRNAMESASRFGTPVLACICCHDDNKNDAKNQINGEKFENAIVVCSLQRQRPGVISPSPSTSSVSITTATNKSSTTSSIHSSIQGMVRLLASRDDIHPNSSKSCIADDNDDDIPKHSLHTAIVTTGIQSDANFLLTQLQTHISKYWFRYDTLPSTSSSVTKMVRDVLLDCLGYDWSNEVGSGNISGGIGSAAPSYNNGQDDNDDDNNSPPTRAGRPLGVCTFLLGLDSTATATTSHPYLTVVKANGASQQYVAHAMGVGSALGNDILSQQWKRGMSRNEAVGMMKNVLKDIAKERGWWTSDNV